MKTPNYVASHAYTARNYASDLILTGLYFVFSQYASGGGPGDLQFSPQDWRGTH